MLRRTKSDYIKIILPIGAFVLLFWLIPFALRHESPPSNANPDPGPMHHCYICGKTEQWNDNWSWRDQRYKLCSDPCRQAMTGLPADQGDGTGQ